NDGFEFINKIANTVDEKEEVHADPNKAKGIAGLLKNENVHVAVTKIFGPNIKRIKSKFVCIIVKSEKITDSFDILKTNFDIILNEWAKGDDRNFLKF
ncbi:MAG: hypothetical protein JW995_02520, partial [Melioribacteraceae bacterium]|nr:hypothetical protein [Melioribacteraceae bacterium]